MRRSIFVLMLLLVASMSWAQAYKWRDASGRIQYSDTPPPPGAKDVQQLRKVPASPQPAAGSTSKTATDQESDFRKRLADKQEADLKQAKAQEEEQMRIRNCELAKEQRATVESGVNLVQFNEKGERIVLDDTEVERRRVEARKNVDAWCK